jgi:hypothetical protein
VGHLEQLASGLNRPARAQYQSQNAERGKTHAKNVMHVPVSLMRIESVVFYLAAMRVNRNRNSKFSLRFFVR